MSDLIINLTQHLATPDQQVEGVIDLPSKYRERLIKLLTFNELPDCRIIEKRARDIGDLVEEFLLDDLSPVKEEFIKIKKNGYSGIENLGLSFMIGGAPFLMVPLVDELKSLGEPMFAFSKRIVVEEAQKDGTVVKKSLFKHQGFVPACYSLFFS
jgi:hypothetical protein